MSTTPFQLMLTPQQLEEARSWVSECQWREDYDESEIADLTPEAIERGIERHYAGGRRQFIVDGEPR